MRFNLPTERGEEMKVKQKILLSLITICLIVNLMIITVFAATPTYNENYTPPQGTATPASASGDIAAVPYKFTAKPLLDATDGLFADATQYRGVFTSPDPGKDYGKIAFENNGIQYTPNADAAEKVVKFKVYGGNENDEWTADGIEFTVVVDKQPRKASNNANLSTLSYQINGEKVTAVPDFSADRTEYTVELPKETKLGQVITLTGSLEDSNASVSYTSATTKLISKTEKAIAVVTAEDGSTKKTYTVNFYVKEENNEPKEEDKKPEDDNSEKEPEHEHGWKTEWTFDNIYHWHECEKTGCPVKDNSQKNGYAVHTYDQKIILDKYKAAGSTCLRPALYYKSCVCGARGTETFEYGDRSDHVWGAWIKEIAATCVAQGTLGHYHCSVCGRDFDANHQELTSLVIAKNPKNHVGSTKIKNAKDATCAKKGYTGDTYCKSCGKLILKGKIIKATNKHTYGKWKVIKEPSFTEKGKKERICSVCGYKETKKIPVKIKKRAAKTGDNNTLAMWLTILIVAGTGLTGTVVYRTKYN